MFDNMKPDEVVWVARHKESGRYGEDYNFIIEGCPNANDNTMLAVFTDGSRGDAEISLRRHFNVSDREWKNWEVVPVRLVLIDEEKNGK